MYPPPMIPSDWWPQQAMAVVEWMEMLCEGIYDVHGLAIAEAREQRYQNQLADARQLPLPLWPSFNDDPF
ncbi:hypothetical protein [Thiorhodovibrio frisius]|uniref:Uncharacterized protein n=1 Tax=Thiorhodovibrio frisius TaxID=631362 RepID=H8Z6L3_9GAMM|nr:hypothetical protein [Thiorhodovibrio frisius]EIC19711.1 hypothetical protein Thi970DRAFT_03304 [Thiorhodovibrio frisius]WPL20323.1 hypothetical protein Thiofri_00403 [Thiorhodovibrio frisius]